MYIIPRRRLPVPRSVPPPCVSAAPSWRSPPGRNAVTWTVAGVTSGYCATGRVNTATPPASMIMSEITVAKIGRSTKSGQSRLQFSIGEVRFPRGGGRWRRTRSGARNPWRYPRIPRNEEDARARHRRPGSRAPCRPRLLQQVAGCSARASRRQRRRGSARIRKDWNNFVSLIPWIT